jgi:alpha-beta hydrolase superfamily lysophospholipase
VPVIDLQIPGDFTLAAKLYLPASAPKPHPGIVLAHGYLSSKEEFLEFPHRLAQAGYAVLTFDFRGHGASAGERGYYTEASHLDDLSRAVEALKAHPDTDPSRLFLLGFSVGNFSTLRMLAERGEAFLGGIAVAPPAQLRQVAKPIEFVLYEGAYRLVAKPLHQLFGIHLRVPYQFKVEDCFHAPGAVAHAKALLDLQTQMPVTNYPYLGGGADNVRVAAQVTRPMLVAVGSEDAVILNPQSRQVYEALASEDKQWVRFVGSGHNLMGDAQGEEFAKMVIDWMDPLAKPEAYAPEANAATGGPETGGPETGGSKPRKPKAGKPEAGGPDAAGDKTIPAEA